MIRNDMKKALKKFEVENQWICQKQLKVRDRFHCATVLAEQVLDMCL